MEYRVFDNLNVKASLLGFGCMRFPVNADGSLNEEEAEKMIDLAIENGVNYIDTAYPYHKGKSEPFLGRVLKKYDRNSYHIATKLPLWDISSKEEVLEIFNAQLKRLGVDYVDFYLLHSLDKEKWETVKKYDIISTCEKLKEEGKIKHFGFSFHDDFELFKTIINARQWDFCQLQINYLDIDIQAGQPGLDYAEKMGVPVIVMEPVKGGALAVLPEKEMNILREYNKDASASSWAFRYSASLNNIKVVLSGMSTLEQVEDNLNTVKDFKPLNEEESALIQKVKASLKAKTRNGCTGCRYCMPCPFGVDIPLNFRYWNTGYIFDNHKKYKQRLLDMKEPAAAEFCRKCGMCEKMCPQQINIREDLAKIAEYKKSED